MSEKPLESDWKVFRERVPEWRERYLSRKNKELIGILENEEKTPTEQFWDAKKKMEEEAEILVTCLDGHSRGKMEFFLLLMYQHGLIGDADLAELSPGLRERIVALAGL